MKLLSSLRTFLNFVFRRQRVEHEMEEELRSHIQDRADDLERQGLARAEAERQARIEFGGFERYKEECREALGTRLLGELIADVRYGLRQLRRNPGFTAVAVITLALGIGANTAIFSLADAAFFRTLPYSHADRLAFLWQSNKRTGESEGAVSYPNYADWRAQSHEFQDMAFIMFGKQFLSGSGTKGILPGPNGPERVPGALVSSNFFSVLGVNPVLGRGFVSDDAVHGHTSVTIISYGLWQARFSGSVHVIGRQVKLGSEDDTIIGVMPRGFAFPYGTEMWKPREVNAFLQTKARQYPNMAVIARLKPDATWPQAQAEMATIGKRLANQYPSIDGGVGVRVVPLREQFSEKVRQGIFVLWGAILGVLLIACLNTASLMIGRTAARQKEIAVRLSLGATRWRLARQLITESSSLALAGAGLGILLAVWATSLVSRLNPDIERLNGSVFDVHVLGYTLAITIAAAFICGTLAVLTIPRLNLNEALKETAAVAAPATHITRKALIVAEVSIALMLLIGSGLLIRSLWQILSVNPGFDADHVLTFHAYWAAANTKETNSENALFAELLARLRALPRVTSVGSASFVLFPSEMYKVPFELAGQSGQSSGQKTFLPHAEASPDFFRTMGIPLMRGRVFSAADTANNAPPVAIINQTMARRYWPHENPIGKRFKFADPNFKSPWFTIVGVVGDVRQEGLENSAGLMAYVPSSEDWADDIVIRTAGNPLTLITMVRREARNLDKNLVIDHMRTASSMLTQREAQRRFNALLLTGFAILALSLAVIGIYGVLAYWVGQRTHEIGIRVALGAQKRDVLRLVVGQGMILTLIGVGIGIIGALGLTRFLSSLLYGVKPTDPLTFVVVSLILTGVALLACYIPARRAMKIDPMEALRYE